MTDLDALLATPFAKWLIDARETPGLYSLSELEDAGLGWLVEMYAPGEVRLSPAGRALLALLDGPPPLQGRCECGWWSHGPCQLLAGAERAQWTAPDWPAGSCEPEDFPQHCADCGSLLHADGTATPHPAYRKREESGNGG